MHEIVRTAQILLVEPDEERLTWIARALTVGGFANVVSTRDPRRALPLFLEIRPDLVLLDERMPYLDGRSVIRQLRGRIPPGRFLPVVLITEDPSPESRKGALLAGASDFIVVPSSEVEVVQRVRLLLNTRALRLLVAKHDPELHAAPDPRLEQVHMEALEKLARAGEQRDDATGRHTHRVAALSHAIALRLGYPERDAELIRRAAPLHDIGKIGVPDAVLLKPGRLSAEEYEVMKEHTIKGALILSDSRSPVLHVAEEIALAHHERWDGSGYAGLRDDEIPPSARIVAVSDVFDALTHDRPYRPAWSFDEAVAEVLVQRERGFDPEVVDAFSSCAWDGTLLRVIV